MSEYKCKVCGRDKDDDKRFVVSKMLCRKHNEQMIQYGKIVDESSRLTGDDYKCDICGDTKASKYYRWRKDDEYKGKMVCNKHYIQLNRKGKLLDELPSTKNIERKNVCCVCNVTDAHKYYICQKHGEYYGKEVCGKHYNQLMNHNKITDPTFSQVVDKAPSWTDEEIKLLEECYSKYMSVEEMIKLFPNRTSHAITGKANRLGFDDKYIKSNNPKYKAIYQDYDWCYQKYFIERKSYKEMAEEAGASERVIIKWCSEVHRLNANYIKHNLKLTDIQHDLIMFSLLGDGHIDKRETQPVFIVSHAENQKDYLFWKYNILKSICNSEPSYITDLERKFGDRVYKCQNTYRFGTKIIDDLIPIRSMKKSEIINQLTEFGLAVHFLDDASCDDDGFWSICYAAFTEEEKELYRNVLKEKFGIEARLRKDNRYIGFNKADSKKISEIILRNIPNDLDIIKYKILEKGVA